MADDAAIRLAEAAEIPALAELWHAGWMEAHAAHVPAALTRIRTKESFLIRLADFGDRLRVTGPPGAPTGLCVVTGAELDQLFVAPSARGGGGGGGGAARALLADGEARIAAAGHAAAFLYCAIGNERASRFYQRCGWRLKGEEEALLKTEAEPFVLTTWVFEKSLEP